MPLAVGRELDSPDDLLAAIGDGRIPAREIVRALYPQAPVDADHRNGWFPSNAPGGGARSVPRPLLIRGLIPGLATHFARCCHPIPGDRIVGIITTGKGVTVHTEECLTLESFSHTPERWIELDWEDEPGLEQPGHVGRMRVTAANKPRYARACRLADRGQPGEYLEPQIRQSAAGLLRYPDRCRGHTTRGT